jgi:hypothetical protein
MGTSSPAPRRAAAVRIALCCAAVLLFALALRVAYGAADLGYDARFSLLWGQELSHLASPDYGSQLSPTSHPLADLIGLVASLFGRSGPAVLAAFSYAAFAGLGAAAFLAGRRAFGTAAGVAFAAILLTRPLLVAEALGASIDILFLALVLAALALELGGERRGTPVLIVLALAGLLRPEAWLLALAYAAYAMPPLPPRRRIRLGALALSAPIGWLLFDLVTAGDALYSLTRTQDLAGTLQRERGLSSAVRDIPVNLQSILGAEVAWCGIAAGAVALVLVQNRARLPTVLLALGLLGFLALGVADLPLLTRYLLVPAAMLALLCAAGLGAFEWSPPGRRRLLGLAIGAAVAAALATTVSGTRAGLALDRERVADGRAMNRALIRLADVAQARGLERGCAPVQAATHRAIPALAYRLGVRPSRVRVVVPSRARRGVVFSALPAALIGDVGLYPGVTIRAQELVPPRGFRRLAANHWWSLAGRC